MGLISATVNFSSATLSAAAGQRIVCIGWNRSGAATFAVTPDAGGAVWTNRLVEPTLPANGSARRSVAVAELLPTSVVSSVNFTAAWDAGGTNAIWLVVEEGAGWDFAGATVADSATTTVASQGTGSTAALSAGDVLAVAAAVIRDGGSAPVSWTTTAVQPALVGGGSALLDVYDGGGAGANAGAAGYLSAAGQAAQAWSDTVTLPVADPDKLITAGLVVWVAADTGITGTLAVTEAADTLDASGSVAPPAITGSLAAVEAADTLAASGTVTTPGITGTVSAIEQPDTLAAAGTHTPPLITGTLAVTEQADTLAAAGTHDSPGVAGSVAVTEEPDTLAAAGGFTPGATSGAVAVVEQDDALAAAGAVDNSAVVTPAPSGRTVTVAAESRTAVVLAEHRRVAVASEARLLSVLAGLRVAAVPAEVRVLTVERSAGA